MNTPFPELCTRLSESLTKINFSWTSVWVDRAGNVDTRSTAGNIWATNVLTFDDSNLYQYEKTIGQLTKRELVVDATVRNSLFGPRLLVSTRYDAT